MTTATPYQYRVFIGPRHVPETSAYYFNWLTLRSTFDFGDYYSRNLSSDMRTNTGEVRINNTIGFPTAGGVYIWPQMGSANYDNETVEYIQYSGFSLNTMTGVLRQSSRRSPHTAGSHMSPLFELGGVTVGGAAGGPLSLEFSVDDELLVHEWVARFSGWLCPEGAMKPGHYALVQERHMSASGTWSSWSCHCLGILDTLKKTDDSKHHAQWDGTIRPIPSVAMDTQLDAIRIGTWTIEENSSATSSTTLPQVAAYKERSVEGYAAASPSFAAQNVLEDSNVPWIANRYITSDGSPHMNTSTDPRDNQEWDHTHESTGFNNQQYSAVLVTQVHINLPAGMPKGYKWIELTTYVPEVVNLRIVNKYNRDPVTGELYQMITPRTLTGMATGSHIIICENTGRFEEMNPDHGAAVVISAEECAGNIFDWLDPVRDGIAVVAHGTGQHLSIMGWGNQDMSAASWRYANWSNVRVWTNGGTPPAPKTGETIRYIYNPPSPTQSRDYWSTGHIETPGYDLPGWDRDGKLDMGSEDVPPPWIMVELPGLDLSLASALSPGATSIPIQDGTETASVNGLQPAGVVQIGEEQITYTGKDYEAGRLTGLTVTQPHAEGDIVYQVQQGTITDGYPIKSITLGTADSGIRPEGVTFGFSQLTLGARTPDEGGYENDYFIRIQRSWSNLGGVYTINNVSNQRLRTVLFEFRSLNSEPNRPRVKSISFEVNREQFDADYWLEEDEAGVILEDVLARVGVPVDAVTYESGLPVVDGQITSATAARSVVQDFLRNKVCTMLIRADSTVHISRNSFWLTNVHTESMTFGEGEATSISLESDAPDSVRYVSVEYDDDGTISTVRYPATDNPAGAIVEVGTYDTDVNGANPIAINTYRMANWRRTATVDLAGSWPGIDTGDLVRLEWQFHRNSPSYSKRHIVTGVVQTIRDGHLFTRLVTRQIDSEEVD